MTITAKLYEVTYTRIEDNVDGEWVDSMFFFSNPSGTITPIQLVHADSNEIDDIRWGLMLALSAVYGAESVRLKRYDGDTYFNDDDGLELPVAKAYELLCRQLEDDLSAITSLSRIEG